MRLLSNNIVNMEANFTILLIVALIVWLILIVKTQITNRKCFLKAKTQLEKYGLMDTTTSENDIPNILKRFPRIKAISRTLKQVFTMCQTRANGEKRQVNVIFCAFVASLIAYGAI